MSPTSTKLTDLPTPLQSYIFSHLFKNPPRRHSIAINLKSLESSRTCLPDDLLAIAKSSTSFREPVADVLGVNAHVLNGITVHSLHEWVAALGPFVKAVTFANEPILMKPFPVGFTSADQQHLDQVLKNAALVFQSLSARGVRLQVLDLRRLASHRCKQEEDFIEPLVAALEQNRDSLREVGLRVTPQYAKAIKRISLPNLQVVELLLIELYFDEQEDDERDEVSWRRCHANAFMDMLKALEGHAERAENRTTLRDLRFPSLPGAPCTAHVRGCAGLFNAVKILRLGCFPDTQGNAMAKFISLFTNLESLHCEGHLTRDNLRLIHDTCTGLEETHLLLDREDIWENIWENYSVRLSKLDETLLACKGKLVSLETSAQLTMEELRILGESNVNLKFLKMSLGRQNVDGLLILLESHCRKLHSLKISVSYDVNSGLDEAGWLTFASAVASASEELDEISVKGMGVQRFGASVFYAVVQCIKEIVEFLGERARKVRFPLYMNYKGQKNASGALRMLMRTCGDHSKQLEELELSIFLVDKTFKFADQEEEKETWEQLLEEKKRMLVALPSLKSVYFGGVIEYAEERLSELH